MAAAVVMATVHLVPAAAAMPPNCADPPRATEESAPESALAWYAAGPDWPIAVAAEGDVVVAGGMAGDVAAYDAATGDVRWFTPLDAMPLDERPQIGSALVAVAAGPRLAALDRVTGEVQWEREIEPRPRLALALTASGETLFMADPEVRFSAIDLTTGADRWVADLSTRGTAQLSVHASRDAVVASLIGRRLGHVYVVLDPDTGAERWRVRARPHSPAPILTAGLVIIPRTGLRSELVAHDAVTGAVRWRLGFAGRFVETLVPTGDDEHVAVLDRCGVLTLVATATGDLEWTTSVGRPPRATYLRLTPSQVLLSSGPRLVTIDRATGQVTRGAPRISLNDLATVGDRIVLLLNIEASGALVVLDRRPLEAPPLH